MKKGRVRQTNQMELNQKRMRVVFIFVLMAAILIVIGGAFIGLRELVIPDLENALLFELLGMVGLYSGALVLSGFFLYLFSIITFKNPQKLKLPKVWMFATGGVTVLIFTIWLIGFGSQDLMNDSQALKDYKNGNWAVKELYVKDVFGPDLYSNLTTLETEEGDFTLYWRPFQIFRGETYRITFLEKTKTVIKIEALD